MCLLGGLAVCGCDQAPQCGPLQPEAVLSATSNLSARSDSACDIRDVPAVDVDLSGHVERTDPELVRQLDSVDGYATVGFKEPESPRTVETARAEVVDGRVRAMGTRAAVSAATIRAALDSLELADVQIVNCLARVGMAVVIVAPDSGPTLRRKRYVDFLVPRYSLQLAGDQACGRD